MIFGWLKRRPDLRSTWLDDLLDEIAESDDREQRERLWSELFRRFNQDVERACRVVSGDRSRERARAILDRAIRTIGSEDPAFFSRDLVKIMKLELGIPPVDYVVRGLYLRQFVTLVSPRHTRYLEAFLDNESQFEWTAEALKEPIETVKAGVTDAWKALAKAIQRKYSDADLAERTDGYWTHATFPR